MKPFISTVSFICLLGLSSATLLTKCTHPTCRTYGSLTLFAAGLGLPYEEAYKDCYNNSGRPFIPKTKDDNHVITYDFMTSIMTHECYFMPYYPKTFNKITKTHNWLGSTQQDDHNIFERMENLGKLTDENVCFLTYHYPGFKEIYLRVTYCDFPNSFYAICEFVPELDLPDIEIELELGLGYLGLG